VFTFDTPLNDIDFTLSPIDTLIYIYISSISSEKFSINDAYLDGNTLKLTLTFISSFSA